MRPRSVIRHPVASWLLEVKNDSDLAPSLRQHLLSIGRQAYLEVDGAGVIHQGLMAGWLVVYRRLRERPPDAITSGRLLGELVRTARAMGLLLKVGQRRSRSRDGGGVFCPPRDLPPEIERELDDEGDQEAETSGTGAA